MQRDAEGDAMRMRESGADNAKRIKVKDEIESNEMNFYQPHSTSYHRWMAFLFLIFSPPFVSFFAALISSTRSVWFFCACRRRRHRHRRRLFCVILLFSGFSLPFLWYD